MKRQILNALAAAALAALAAGCAKEPQAAAPAGAEAEVSFTVSSPEIMTRAIADGNTVDRVACVVYDEAGEVVNGTTETPISQTVDMTGGKAKFKVRLVTGQTYSFLFWAYKDGASCYTLDRGNKKVTVNYAGVSNDENRDAFYAYRKDVKISGEVSETVTLKRPFAQLNFGTTAEDVAAAKAAGIEVAKSSVKLTGLATELNLADGSVDGSADAVFTAANLPDASTEKLIVKGTEYVYVATNYVLVGADQKTISNAELTVYKSDDTEVNTLKVPNVPLQGNYRTNVIGNLFTSALDYNIVVGPDFDNPDYNGDVDTPYVTFSADGTRRFKMSFAGATRTSLKDKLEYSVGWGEWKTVEHDATVEFGGEYGDLRLRGKCSSGTGNSGSNYATITFPYYSGTVAASGDIRTLIDWENYETVATDNAKFRKLFYGAKTMTSAPELPATELADGCYLSMFNGCTSLTSAPALPATTLKKQCYYDMFYGCTSLTAAPELPATTLAESCYYQMFSGCTSLTTAPLLPATNLAAYCYAYMFQNCDPLTSAPALPATTLADYCYHYMFSGCISLTAAPELPAETLVNNCYSKMFWYCESLNSVTIKATGAATGVAINDALENWLYGVASTGTVNKSASLTLEANSASGIPNGWTSTDL